MRRLSDDAESEAASDNGFRLRIGLFGILDVETRQRILTSRDQFLASREQRLAGISTAVEADTWSSEVMRFYREQIRAERAWIATLVRKSRREAKPQRVS
jgi:hypothetical protein